MDALSRSPLAAVSKASPSTVASPPSVDGVSLAVRRKVKLPRWVAVPVPSEEIVPSALKAAVPCSFRWNGRGRPQAGKAATASNARDIKATLIRDRYRFIKILL